MGAMIDYGSEAISWADCLELEKLSAYIPVCVGMNSDFKRFMVHTTMLGEEYFLELLYRSAEEYGCCNEGMRIPYKQMPSRRRY